MRYAIQQLLRSSNFLSLAGNVSFAFFNAITFLLMARMLDRSLFGEWIIYVTAASLLNMLRLGLTGTGAIRSISMSSGSERKAYIGATYQLGVFTFIITCLLFYPAFFALRQAFATSYYYPVLLFYPLLSLVNLPYNQASVVTQARLEFGKLLTMRTIHGASMLVFIAIYMYYYEATLTVLILLHALSNFLPGLLAILMRWDGMQWMMMATRAQKRELLNFGKYSAMISVGSSLLRSADTFILSMSAVMGASAIAMYAIPMKFVEAVEIPLRSFSATAYPKLSQAFKLGNERFNTLLLSYNVATTILILPILLVFILFAEPLLSFVGGVQYQDSIQLQKYILYIILAYILLLPADRYTGVALFALDRPVKNFYKTMIMLVANVFFDLIAVFVLESLIAVALATLIFTITGVFWGWFFVKKETQVRFSDTFLEGRQIIRQALLLLRKKDKT